MIRSSLLPWTIGAALLAAVSLLGNLVQAVNATVNARLADTECQRRIDAALDAREAAAAVAGQDAQDDVDASADRDTRAEATALAAIVRERDRAVTELRRLQHAATSPTAGPADHGCRVPADRVRVLNGALSTRTAGPQVQSHVPSAVR